MVQVNEGISLEIMSCFEHYANTLRNLILDICDMWNPCYFIINNNTNVLSLSVAVNIESPIYKSEVWLVNLILVLWNIM